MTSVPVPDYFRRDQEGGITAPDLSKGCTWAEHIVRARGKRTKFTSVSLDRDKIDDFGPVLYQALCVEIEAAGHDLIGHDRLMKDLRSTAASRDKSERRRAIQALDYARRRREGLIDWKFRLPPAEKDVTITWASKQVQKFFRVL
jgi:hypothetical protein